ncbi:MAG: citrate/2-methylcitrate synthase [Acidimicrobiales bacterium]
MLADWKPEQRIVTNVEYWASVVLELAGLPQAMFTPTFSVSRSIGWSAHIIEQHRGRQDHPSERPLRRPRAAGRGGGLTSFGRPRVLGFPSREANSPMHLGARMAVTDGIDLWDMDAFQRQEHHEMLEKLRETDPGIHWIDEGDMGPGFWAITRLEHLREVNRQADIFSSNRGGTQMQERNRADDLDAFQNDSLMLSMDPPKHTRYRRIVSRGFTRA